MKQKLAVLALSIGCFLVATDATAGGRLGRGGLRASAPGCAPGGFYDGPVHGGGFYGGYSAPRGHFGAHNPLHHPYGRGHLRYSSPGAYPYYHATPYYEEVYEGNACPPVSSYPSRAYPSSPVTPIPSQPAPVPPPIAQPAPVPPPTGEAPVPPPVIEQTPAPAPAAPAAPAPAPAPVTPDDKPPAPPLK